MSLVKISNQPFSFNRFFDEDLFNWSNKPMYKTGNTLPSVNIRENADAFVIEVAAPGFDKNDFKLELNRSLLTVSSEKKAEEETKEGETYTKREFSYESFSRTFNLPVTVNSDAIEASYEKGILEVTIPKRDEAKPKPARTIEIN